MTKGIFFITLLCLFSASTYGDTVNRVYLCGNNLVIHTQNSGPLVVLENEVGEKRLDRMLSVALTLVTTQKNMGYINPGSPRNICGINNVRPITVLGINKN